MDFLKKLKKIFIIPGCNNKINIYIYNWTFWLGKIWEVEKKNCGIINFCNITSGKKLNVAKGNKNYGNNYGIKNNFVKK